MPIGSIPQFRVPTPEEMSPLTSFIKGAVPAYQQGQQLQQQKQALGLQQQIAQMQADRQAKMAPFQQRKLEAETGLAEAKSAAYPQQQQQQQQQQQAKMALSWAQNVLKANADDPNFSKDPANQQALAQAMAIQNNFLGSMQGAPQQQQPMLGQQQGAPGQPMQQPGMAQPGMQQPQQPQQPQMGLSNLMGAQQPQLSPEYKEAIESAQKAQEGKRLKEQYTPTQLDRISRIVPAKKAYDSAKSQLMEVLPFLGPGQSLKRAAENMAATSGIPLDQATIKVNTLFKKTIPALAKEMGPGFGVPTAEKAYERFEKFVNPESFGQPEQIMANFNAVGDLLQNVGETLLKTPSAQIEEGKSLFGKNVPRGTQTAQGPRQSIDFGGQTYTREQLMKIAAGGQ